MYKSRNLTNRAMYTTFLTAYSPVSMIDEVMKMMKAVIFSLLILLLSTTMPTFQETTDGYYHMHEYRNPRAAITCDEYPELCNIGASCCLRRCVDLEIDELNCGECGMRCGYGQTCCDGKCSNFLFDKNNCGFRKNRCGDGSFCRYGMCNYA